jgi:predicted DNA-binding ribbon-helix-helix protein
MPENSETRSDDRPAPASRGPSTLVNRNVFIGRHRTSIRLEPAMWDSLAEICSREDMSLHEVCSLIDARRQASSLTAAIRVFTLTYFRVAATEDGHARCGHGLLYSSRRRSARTPVELNGETYRRADPP